MSQSVACLARLRWVRYAIGYCSPSVPGTLLSAVWNRPPVRSPEEKKRPPIGDLSRSFCPSRESILLEEIVPRRPVQLDEQAFPFVGRMGEMYRSVSDEPQVSLLVEKDVVVPQVGGEKSLLSPGDTLSTPAERRNPSEMGKGPLVGVLLFIVPVAAHTNAARTSPSRPSSSCLGCPASPRPSGRAVPCLGTGPPS